MSSEFKLFSRENAKFWKRIGTFRTVGNKVVISEQAVGGSFWSLVVSISASLVAAAYGAKVVYLIKVRGKRRGAFHFQRTFGNCEFVFLEDTFQRKQESIKKESADIYKGLTNTRDILDIVYKGIPIGEQVYDAVIKYKHATLWRVNENVLTEIENSITCIEAILEVFQSYDVVAGMFTHTTCSYHGVAVRAILSQGKPVFQGFGGSNALYRYNYMLNGKGQLDIHIKIPVDFFKQVMATRKDVLLEQATLYYKKRFGGEINDWDAMRAFAPGKKLYNNRVEFFADYPKLNPENKNVFIMLHAMNDDPHVQVQRMFKDYYEWFATTLKIAKNSPATNWIFKQHPMIKFYPDDANLLGLFDQLEDVSNIVYIDENAPFNQASVPNVADAIITCAGTAGLEFSALGIPAIIAARNSYSGYGICHEPETLADYHKMLNNVNRLEPVEPLKREEAKVLFYLIYNRLIPSFQTGFFPYMNNDQMKALTEPEARDLYLKALKNNANSDFRDLFSFVMSDGTKSETDLYLNISN
ncbi:capsular polysaccharide export protein, LipB/KpsS family [Chryseolinea serpens]|uniref:capsular polysaccharide export protein, LipB/KpsS family n=1 Tax=Chryseolinea serpens TaxID=947013 RepID=UPI0015BA4359|nr:hypothetical protein [Chryseolinea serpens]